MKRAPNLPAPSFPPAGLLPASLLVMGVFLFALVPTPVEAQTGQFVTHGSVDVPGGDNIDYDITVTKNPGRNTVHLNITVKNPTNKPMSFIACAMVQTNFPAKDIPSYKINQIDNATTGKKEWVCYRDGNASRRPSVHFGCKFVTLKAGETKTIFDDDSLPLPPAETITETNIKSVYWDVLENFPFSADGSCAAWLAGQVNVNIGPAFEDLVAHTANVWGGTFTGGTCGETLVNKTTGKANPGCASLPPPPRSCPHSSGIAPIPGPGHGPLGHCRVARFEVGNWYTMEIPGHYLGRIQGGITGLPPGAKVDFVLPGEFELNYTADSAGRVDGIQADFTTMYDPEMPMDMEDMWLRVTSETPPPEGTVSRFQAAAVARAGSDIYEPGQFMYGVSVRGIQDTVAPQIRSTSATPAGTSFFLSMSALDATTKTVAAQAVVTYGATDRVVDLVPDGYGPDGSTRYAGEIADLPTGTDIVTVFGAYDQEGNLAVSQPVHTTIAVAETTGTSPTDLTPSPTPAVDVALLLGALGMGAFVWARRKSQP